MLMESMDAPAAAMNASAPMGKAATLALNSDKESASDQQASGQAAENMVDLDTVSIRKNLNETAFFYPDLVSNEDGVVRIEFTMPEALTEWRFWVSRMTRNCDLDFYPEQPSRPKT